MSNGSVVLRYKKSDRYKKFILLVKLLPGIQLVAMEQAKPLYRAHECSQSESFVTLLLTDSDNPPTTHEVSLPLSHARLLGAIADLLEYPDLRETVFPLQGVSLYQWGLVGPQLERVCRIGLDELASDQLTKEICASYEKLDAHVLIELIKTLDYLDIPQLLVIACEVVRRDAFNRFTLEQVLPLPRAIGNRIMLQKLLSSYGPMPAREFVVCKGHVGRVTSVCVATDGQIVTGSFDKTVRVYNAQGKELAVCRGHDGEVQSVCITKDGSIVSGSEDATVRVWDMKGNELSVCRGHQARVWSVSLLHESTIVSGSRDTTVRVWNMNGKERAVCRGHEGDVGQVCVTDDGKIVSSSRDKTVRVWDVRGKELAVCRGHEDQVYAICVTNDGKIVSCSDDKTVRVWDMHGSQLAVCRGHENWVECVCVTRDRTIVSGSRDMTVRVWDMNGKERAVCRGHEAGVLSVGVTRDGKIVSGCGAGTVRVWDMKGTELALCRGHDGEVWSMCVSHDNKIISGFDHGVVRVWDISLLDRINLMDENRAHGLWKLLERFSRYEEIDKKKLWKEIEGFFGEIFLLKMYFTDTQNHETAHAVVIPLRFAQLIGALSDLLENLELSIMVFSLPHMTLFQWGFIESQLERVYSILHDHPHAEKIKNALTEDYKKVDAHGVIELIRALDRMGIPLLQAIASEVVIQDQFDKFSYDQVFALSGRTGKRIMLHKLLRAFGPISARKRAVGRGHAKEILKVCVTTDDKIVSAGDDATVRVWDIQGNEHAVCRGHEKRVTSLCVTHEGTIVSGSHDKTIRVWDMKGKERAVCRGHAKRVTAICLLDTTKIVSGSKDTTVCVWDMLGNELVACLGHEGSVTSVAATTDGKIVSGSCDRTVRVWDVKGNQLADCRGHDREIVIVRITITGKIISSSLDKSHRVWDMQGNQLGVFRNSFEGSMMHVGLPHDSKMVLGVPGTNLWVSDIQGKKLARFKGDTVSLNSICVTNSGKIVVGSRDGTVSVWDISLLDRIESMDTYQAKAVWEYLQKYYHSLRDKLARWECLKSQRNLSNQLDLRKVSGKEWDEIEKILGENAPVGDLSTRNKNSDC